MAPRAVKRTSSAAASPKKKSRASPLYSSIISTLEGADGLSENCRDMLIAMASPSLATVKSERHNMQQMGVRMIEEVLAAHKKKLLEAAAVAQKALTELEGSKSVLTQNLDAAKALLEDRKAAFLAAATVREEAKAAVKAAEAALAEAIDTQKKGDANHAKLEGDKASIEAVYQEHFKVPMDANEGPHYNALKPFVENLGLEDSLTSALASSCVKSKDQRGGFDDLVLGELGKAFVAKIETLEKSIADEAAGVSTRKAAIVSAEALVESNLASQAVAASSLEVAATAKHEAEAAFKHASEEMATFDPRVQEATDEYNLQDTIRMDFEEGALKEFANLRDKEAPAPVEEEAAPLGA